MCAQTLQLVHTEHGMAGTWYGLRKMDEPIGSSRRTKWSFDLLHFQTFGYQLGRFTVGLSSTDQQWKPIYHCQFMATTDSDSLFCIKNIFFSYEIRSRQTLFQNCKVKKYLKLFSSQLLNLRWFICPNIQYKVSDQIWDGWQCLMETRST
jgi:hypothetical protein